jgi:ribosome-associated protein
MSQPGPILVAGRGWQIAERDVEFRFIRASGPGGQNVNKVSSAVELRFDLAGAAFHPAHAERLKRLAGDRLTLEGVIVLKAERFRSQERNREDAIARLAALVEKAATVPRRRIATKPTKASQERRLAAKSGRGRIKSGRGRIDLE